MSFNSWLSPKIQPRRRQIRKAASAGRNRAFKRRVFLEALEDRRLLATIVPVVSIDYPLANTLLALTEDQFAYNPGSATPNPDQISQQHFSQATSSTALKTITLDLGGSFDLTNMDVWGRDSGIYYQGDGPRDDDMTITFWSGGVGGTQVSQLADQDIISSNGGPNYLAVSVPVGAVDTVTIASYKAYFTLAEVRLAGSNSTIAAENDAAETEEDVAATIDVLANDSVNAAGTLAITSVSTPNFGTAVVDGRGTSTTSDDRIVYTPSLNDSGTATFQYTITDGLGNTATAIVTVNVTPVNDAPVVDLNGQDETGIDFTTIFVGSATLLSDADALLTDVDGGVIGSATAANGDIFVVNRDGRVTKIDPTTGVQTLISSGALILDARGLAIDDATGNIYVADAGRRAVVKVDRNTGAETIVATGFVNPWGIAVEADGKVLVADVNARSIIRVDPATGAKTTVKSGLYSPYGVEVASDGTILVADAWYLRKINPTNGAMTSTASLGFQSYDIAEDANGALIVANYSQIRRVDFTTGSSTIIASNVNSYFLAMGADNDIVASSYGNSNVKVVDGSTGTLSILASGGNLNLNLGVDIDGGVVYGDNIASLTVSITNLLDGANEVLTADVSGTAITASYNSATGVLSLTGDDTAANYQAVLSTITYNNTATSPTSTARVIRFVANDGLDSSQPAAFATVVLNRHPVINDQVFSLNENLTAIGTVAASDPDTADTLTYSIGGGLDAARFEINSSTGALSFLGTPDFENPSDSNCDNIYDVIVTVNDGKGGAADGNVTVNITNVTAIISGTVFVDADGDGLFDGGSETAIDNVIVELYDSDGGLLDSDQTELGGAYAFSVDDEFGTLHDSRNAADRSE